MKMTKFRTPAQIKRDYAPVKKEWDANKMAGFAVRERIAKKVYPILTRLHDDELEPAISYTNAISQGYDRGKVPTAKQMETAKKQCTEYRQLLCQIEGLLGSISITLGDAMEDLHY